MLGETRLKIYRHAYSVRMAKGESVSKIDKSYLDMKRLTEEEVKQIHISLGLEPADKKKR